MALIEYIEPINIGSIFEGIVTVIFGCVVTWIIYRLYLKLIQVLDVTLNRLVKYELIEEFYLDKHAKKIGIDLDRELIKKKMLRKKSKSLQKRIHDEIMEDLFPKETETKK